MIMGLSTIREDHVPSMTEVLGIFGGNHTPLSPSAMLKTLETGTPGRTRAEAQRGMQRALDGNHIRFTTQLLFEPC